MGNDDNGNNRQPYFHGVMEAAPAYHVDVFLKGMPEAGDKTLEDYLALSDEKRVEMIEGVFYDVSAPTTVHQSIAGEIFNAFTNYVRKNGGSCVPFISPADVQLCGDDRTMVQPDVFVICDRKQITRLRIVGAPALIVEVLSLGNWEMDMYLKLQKYKQSGVDEYWIVVPDEKRVYVYRFGENEEPKEYTFADKVPVGIWENKCKVDFKEINDNLLEIYESIAFMDVPFSKQAIGIP